LPWPEYPATAIIYSIIESDGEEFAQRFGATGSGAPKPPVGGGDTGSERKKRVESHPVFPAAPQNQRKGKSNDPASCIDPKG
jgi:hypothetical protein